MYRLQVYRLHVYRLQVCIDFMCIDYRCIDYMCIDLLCMDLMCIEIVCIDFPEWEKINVKGGGWEPPLWTNSVTWVSEAFPYRHAQYTVHSVHMERAETERGWLSWWPPVRSRPASGQVLE